MREITKFRTIKNANSGGFAFCSYRIADNKTKVFTHRFIKRLHIHFNYGFTSFGTIEKKRSPICVK